MHALASDRVPDSWATVGYASLRSLGAWMHNLLQRVAQIQEWCADLTVPKSVWLSGWVDAPLHAARLPWLPEVPSVPMPPVRTCCKPRPLPPLQAVQPSVLPHGH